mmetsp:Transcript_16006/g.48598  ORF Transcript_16006/g.48598 Transcript_16006/m.48598 type:complete len:92 (-) Transcript_16006:828-1103(-)
MLALLRASIEQLHWESPALRDEPEDQSSNKALPVLLRPYSTLTPVKSSVWAMPSKVEQDSRLPCFKKPPSRSLREWLSCCGLMKVKVAQQA